MSINTFRRYIYTYAILFGCLVLALIYIVYLPGRLHSLDVDVTCYLGGEEPEFFEVSSQQVVGQTFVSNQDNLARIEVQLVNFDFRQRTLLFHLKENPDDAGSIATVRLGVGSFKTVRYGNFLAINFPVQRNSKGKQYYFSIEPASPGPAGEFSILYSTVDRYPEGQMYVNHFPVPGDLVFRTKYLITVKDDR